MRFWKKADDDKNEIIAHEWITLTALWRRISRSPPPTPTPKEQQTIALIEKLLKNYDTQEARQKSAEAEWCDFNEAEQAIGSQLGAEHIDAEYATLLQMADSRGLSDLQSFVAAKATIKDANADLEIKREIYLRLLYRLQSDFVRGRSERRFRNQAADTLFWVGIVFGLIFLGSSSAGFYSLQNVLAPTCGLLGQTANNSSTCLTTSEAYFALLIVVVIAAGAMGACFSRALKFRSYADSLAFAEFVADYTLQIILLRLLYGAIGAAVLFFLIRGGLVGGDMFPSFDKASAWAPEYAKLVLWSFLGGFSERLVPDLLDKTEGRGKEKA